MSKRKSNQTGLKVKYLGATDTKGSRLKFTQTNTGKSKIIPYDHKFETLDKAINVLENNNDVISFNIVIDNTQQDYYLFSIETGFAIPDLLKDL